MNIQEKLEQDRQKVIDLYQSGISMDKLGKIYNCNAGTIYYFLKNHDIETRKIKNFEGKIEDYSDQIDKLYQEGKGSHTIAKVLKLSKPTILRYLQKKFDTSINRTGDPNNLLKDKTDLVIQLYNEGWSCNKIGKHLGHNAGSVRQLLINNKYDTSKKLIPVDETFFEKIDSQDKAYVLGWMFSDGNVTDDGKVRISIHQNDIEILQKIKEVMKYKGDLHFNKQMVTLCIGRQKMAQDLIKLGCPPRKSLILQFPQIEEEWLPHFIRGCYDGDGSILLRKEGKFSTNITSSDDFILGWSKELDKLNIVHTVYKKNPKKTTSSLFTNKFEDSVKLVKFLYKDANLFLQRKYDKCKTYISSVC